MQKKTLVDLSGLSGNIFFLMAQVSHISKSLNLDSKAIIEEMTSSNYIYAINVFDYYFGSVIDLKIPEYISIEDVKRSAIAEDKKSCK